MHLSVLSSCISVHYMYVWYLLGSDESIILPGIGVRWLKDSMWVLGTEPSSSGKLASDINSRARSLTSAQNLEASVDLVLL